MSNVFGSWRHDPAAKAAPLSPLKDANNGSGRLYRPLVIAALAIATALVYYPSLHAPWYMDDTTSIILNPVVRDLKLSLNQLLQPRGMAIFSFALNYQIGGTDPFGYHLVNFALHFCCAVLVYLLLLPVVRHDSTKAALGALLFVVHPLQTQAVIYLVQRMAVLAAFFFLLALWLFARARCHLAAGIPFTTPRHLGCYLGAVVAGACAVYTKENTAVLPVVLYLYGTISLPPAPDRRRLLLSLLPFLAVPLALTISRFIWPLYTGTPLLAIANPDLPANSPGITPLRYLVTEFSVLWVYIRMLFLPYGQTLEHSYPLAENLLALKHLAAGIGLAILGWLAIHLRRRLPLVASGVAWFFATLAVESTIIPLDPLYEHRLYLPMFGFILVLLGLFDLLPRRRTAPVALVVIVLVLLPLAWQRSRLWADPVAFYRDNLTKTPHSERVLTDLAANLLVTGRQTEAEPLLQRALELNPSYLAAFTNLIAVYSKQGRINEAFALARQGLEREPRSVDLLTALGALYFKVGDNSRALQAFDQALALNPHYALAQNNRAAILAQSGRLAEAEEAFRVAVTLNPADVSLRNDLALALKMQGKMAAAAEELQRIVAIDPGNRDALYRLALLAIERGDFRQATELRQRLQHRDPQRALELETAMRNSAKR